MCRIVCGCDMHDGRVSLAASTAHMHVICCLLSPVMPYTHIELYTQGSNTVNFR